jgi:hypothetical protein
VTHRMRHKSMYLSSLFFCLTALLIGSSTSVHADCSQGGCPQGQRCVGDGKSPVLKCVPEPRLTIIAPNWPMASDPVVAPNAPSQQANCYQDSDCRLGYICGKGDLDPDSPGYSSFHGLCLRTPPNCRRDTDCLTDEFCSLGANNSMGGTCKPRPVAKN